MALEAFHWREWFEGLQVVQEEGGTSRLSGFLRDQAALYALLLRIRTLGLTLLWLENEEVSRTRRSELPLPISWLRRRGTRA